MTKLVFTKNLDFCLGLMDNFTWAELVDNLDDIDDAYDKAMRQLGCVEALYSLHLIDSDKYFDLLKMTLEGIVNIKAKHVELMQPPFRKEYHA